MNSPSDLKALLSEDVCEQALAAAACPANDRQPDLPLCSMFRHDSRQSMLNNPTIMIVDDQLVNVKVAEKCLKMQGYRDFLTTTDPTEAFGIIDVQQPDIVLLDIMMPQVSGLEILERVRADERFIDLPIIILTAATDTETKMTALKLGATDFLTKPVDYAELTVRVRNVLMAKSYQDEIKQHAWELEIERPIQMTEFRGAQKEIILTAARAVETRAGMEDEHVSRVARVAWLLADKLGLDEAFAALIEQAAALHDIGKSGVPDVALRSREVRACEVRRPGQEADKPSDPVLQQQCRELRSHTEIGATLLGQSKLPLLRIAAPIALSHHESWDGHGYPFGLSGEAIPVEAQITAVADCLDVLCSERGGPAADALQWALQAIESGSGSCFDPAVVDALVAAEQKVRDIWRKLPGYRLNESDSA